MTQFNVFPMICKHEFQITTLNFGHCNTYYKCRLPVLQNKKTLIIFSEPEHVAPEQPGYKSR